MTTKKDGRRNNRPSEADRANAGRKRTKVVLHVGMSYQIVIDGVARHYEVVVVEPDLILKPTSKLGVVVEQQPS